MIPINIGDIFVWPADASYHRFERKKPNNTRNNKEIACTNLKISIIKSINTRFCVYSKQNTEF